MNKLRQWTLRLDERMRTTWWDGTRCAVFGFGLGVACELAYEYIDRQTPTQAPTKRDCDRMMSRTLSPPWRSEDDDADGGRSLAVRTWADRGLALARFAAWGGMAGLVMKQLFAKLLMVLEAESRVRYYANHQEHL